MKIIPRSAHTVTRQNISAAALDVLQRLNAAGHQAYLVGGCVRDLLLDLHPKDFDIATDAHPETIKSLFKRCRLIGRRFRLAHVLYGREIVEVATFRRSNHTVDHTHASGRILQDNVYGSLEDDVWRRDFTINALYYSIQDDSLLDFMDAMDDLQQRHIKLIGDPIKRYQEDPVRMLRAVRFAAKLDFTLNTATAAPIQTLGSLLQDIPTARLFDEVVKLFHNGNAVKTLGLLQQYDLLRYLFPQTDQLLKQQPYPESFGFIQAALQNTDQRIQQNKSINPAFIYAVFLWLPLLRSMRYSAETGFPHTIDIQKAATAVIQKQLAATALPHRFGHIVRDIWGLQPRLQRYKRRRAESLLLHPRFRAAYDFLCLRAAAGEPCAEAAEWWTSAQQIP